MPNVLKTTIVTTFSLFKFLRMPYDLWNAAQTFHHMMARVFHGVPFIFVYLDDIPISSRFCAEHLINIRQFYFSSIIKDLPKVWRSAADSLEFLGHHVSPAGLVPLH